MVRLSSTANALLVENPIINHLKNEDNIRILLCTHGDMEPAHTNPSHL